MANTIPPELLLDFYCRGMFPMAVDGELRVFSPDPRGILPIKALRVPHGARAALNDPAWEVRIDNCFEEVVRACACRQETWIDERILQSCLELHSMGFAHSVEVWRNGALAGGLYGIAIGGAFFGESMFHIVSGASKVALCRLTAMLADGGFLLHDTQWVTPHLAGFGGVEIPRATYLDLLARALEAKTSGPLARG